MPLGRTRIAPPVATRMQRAALAFGLGAGLLLVFWLFSPILTPFVLAAVHRLFPGPAGDPADPASASRAGSRPC